MDIERGQVSLQGKRIATPTELQSLPRHVSTVVNSSSRWLTARTSSSSSPTPTVSWSCEECKPILTLVLGLILQYGETSTDALHHASALIHRSYANLHALWRHWRHEQEISSWTRIIGELGQPVISTMLSTSAWT